MKNTLSDHEREIAQDYANGYALKQVADHFDLSIETIKKTITRVRTKYRLQGRDAGTKILLGLRLDEDRKNGDDGI